jgi:hypothetical protein
MSKREPTIVPSERTIVGGLEGAVSSSIAPASSSRWPMSAIMAEQGRRPGMRASLSKMRRVLIVAAALMGSVAGLLVGVSSSASAAQPVAAGTPPGTPWVRRPGFQRPIWTCSRGIIRHGRERGQVELHPDHISRSGGDR